MKTYVIFDRKSGDVLQTHVRSDDHHGEMQDLLRELRPESTPESLDVLPVTERLVPGMSYRVDTKVKKLVAVDGTKGTKGRGFGAASIHRFEDGPKDAQRIFVQVKPETP
jgi:hypothetical protein